MILKAIKKRGSIEGIPIIILFDVNVRSRMSASSPTQAHTSVRQSSNKGALAPTRARFKINNCVKNVKWQKSEDELLMKLMSMNERPNYSKLAESFPGKTGQQVAERWDKVLNPKLIKGSWTRREDEIIINYVKEHGTKNWRNLCALLPGRIGKQCRERWRNHLDPNINHSPWTPEEDDLLRRLHAQFGNHWVKISSMMTNRSDNAIKNRWNSTLKKLDLQLNIPPEFVKPDFSEVQTDESPASTPKLLSVINSTFGPSSSRVGFFSPMLMKPKSVQEQQERPISLSDNRNAFLEMIPNHNS